MMMISGVQRDHPLDRNFRDEVLVQIDAIEQQLLTLKASLAAAPLETADWSPACLATRIRRLLKARRARDRFFGRNLFADPAWDILLEAYAASLLEQRTSVTALCNAAAVPATTALRWLNKLEQERMLQRRQDPLDSRRTWIELTPAAVTMMRDYLESISATLPI
jgi:DNA-binding MarR family transcriptional regulator